MIRASQEEMKVWENQGKNQDGENQDRLDPLQKERDPPQCACFPLL